MLVSEVFEKLTRSLKCIRELHDRAREVSRIPIHQYVSRRVFPRNLLPAGK